MIYLFFGAGVTAGSRIHLFTLASTCSFLFLLARGRLAISRDGGERDTENEKKKEGEKRRQRKRKGLYRNGEIKLGGMGKTEGMGWGGGLAGHMGNPVFFFIPW
jgi:hypothetical protein